MRRKRNKKHPPSPIESLVTTVRGKKVLLDVDLANIYGVTTSRLNEQVKRNRDPFPDDFMFQPTTTEFANLMSQIMAANVLNSRRAVQMSVFVVRAFVRLREVTRAHPYLLDKLKELEQRVAQHDREIHGLIEAIRNHMSPPLPQKRRIGFGVEEPQTVYNAKRR